MAPSALPSLKKALLFMCVLLAGPLIGVAQNDVLTGITMLQEPVRMCRKQS